MDEMSHYDRFMMAAGQIEQAHYDLGDYSDAMSLRADAQSAVSSAKLAMQDFRTEIVRLETELAGYGSAGPGQHVMSRHLASAMGDHGGQMAIATDTGQRFTWDTESREWVPR